MTSVYLIGAEMSVAHLNEADLGSAVLTDAYLTDAYVVAAQALWKASRSSRLLAGVHPFAQRALADVCREQNADGGVASGRRSQAGQKYLR